MYQTIIRDPGGNNLIRIRPDISGNYSAVVNGSVLIVPPGTTAFVAINGELSRPYGPGRYTIFTGTDPFFVRLRNAMTHGDSGTTVSVFFVSTEKTQFIRLGTGEFPFHEKRFNITMKALASCSLAFSIANPVRILQKLVGTYSSSFNDDDMNPCIEQMVLPAIREALSREISRMNVVSINSNLGTIGRAATGTVRNGLSDYGIRLERFSLVSVNIPETEIQRLYALEQEYAAGRNRTDLELDNLQRVWNGNVHNRTFGEMMTGIASRGQPFTGGTPTAADSGNRSLTPLMLQMMLLGQMMPTLRESFQEMAHASDFTATASTGEHDDTPPAGSPPPLPHRNRH